MGSDHESVNVGTVLFTNSDNYKDCWSSENIALLTSRMLLEDVLPSKDVLVIHDNAFITDLIDYFRLVLEVVRKMTHGKTKHIMLLALTDLLGGYLNHLVLPVAKHAYYAGFIDFDSMEKLYQLFDEVKCFLRTNGHGWRRPITNFGERMQAQPLPVAAAKNESCKGLIYYEKQGTNKHCQIGIPMPFFDSKSQPTAIAVPFKTFSLRNLESRSSSYVLVKFYIAATKCLQARNVDKMSITEFNTNFYLWMQEQVLPRLCNCKFYSAFGGILRIEETLSHLGLSKGSKEIGNFNIMPEMQIKESTEGTSLQQPEEQPLKRKKLGLILMALVAMIFICFILGCVFVCYRIKAVRSRRDDCLSKCGRAYYKATSKPSHTSAARKPSKASSKAGKVSSRGGFESSGDASSKKLSASSGTSKCKKSMTASTRTHPGHSSESAHIKKPPPSPSAKSGEAEVSQFSSTGTSYAPSGSKHSTSSTGTGKSRSSSKSRSERRAVHAAKKQKKLLGRKSRSHTPSSADSKTSKTSAESKTTNVSKGTSMGKSVIISENTDEVKTTATSSTVSKGTVDSKETLASKNLDDNKEIAPIKHGSDAASGHPVPPRKDMYRTPCLCHPARSKEKHHVTSSSGEVSAKKKHPPLVFGYELQSTTSAESSPRKTRKGK